MILQKCHRVLIFLMADVGEEYKVALSYPEVWTTYTLDLNNQHVIVVAISLLSRDGGREKRLELIKNIHGELQASGYKCQGVSCGLLYEDIAELHCSYQEAQIALEEVVKSKDDSKFVILFFDELARVIRRVPHAASNLLEEFRETIEVRDEKKAVKLLERLVVVSKNMTEELLVYRYLCWLVLFGFDVTINAPDRRVNCNVSIRKLSKSSMLFLSKALTLRKCYVKVFL